jgi:hypothetical protein
MPFTDDYENADQQRPNSLGVPMLGGLKVYIGKIMVVYERSAEVAFVNTTLLPRAEAGRSAVGRLRLGAAR